jgi:hypothetical protein
MTQWQHHAMANTESIVPSLARLGRIITKVNNTLPFVSTSQRFDLARHMWLSWIQ